MEMTQKDIAQLLLNRRNSRHAMVLDSATRQKLGHEGFAFALKNSWIELDETRTMMGVSSRANKLEEMKTAASANEGQKIHQEAAPIQRNTRDLELIHAAESCRLSAPSNDFSRISERMIVDEAQPGEETFEIGEDVAVVDGGETYLGKVQAKKSDGRLVISFGDKKPRVTKDGYDRKEVKKLANPSAASKPSRPEAPAPPSGPTSNANTATSVSPMAR